MNYRHAFHAGNFADIYKHAALLGLLGALRGSQSAVSVIDTHAGAGLYRLRLNDQPNKEASAGILALNAMKSPPASLSALLNYVRAKNGPAEALDIYPGSPVLISDHVGLRAYTGFELRLDDFLLLREALGPKANLFQEDGYEGAIRALSETEEEVSQAQTKTLLLIDPPFEESADYGRITDTLTRAIALDPGVGALVWLPLKDLDTYDRFLGRLEEERSKWVAKTRLISGQLRLNQLSNPLKMNGCVLVCLNPPMDFLDPLKALTETMVGHFGEENGAAIVQDHP